MKTSWCWLSLVFALVSAQELLIQQPKPVIYYSGILGGVSHNGWPLEILETLRLRGYNVSFISTEPNQKYLDPFPNISFLRLRDEVTNASFRSMFDPDDEASKKGADTFAQYLRDVLPDQKREYVEIFTRDKPALVICDHINFACMDVASWLDIPMAQTSTIMMSEDPPFQFVDREYIDSDDSPTSLFYPFVAFYRYWMGKLRYCAVSYGVGQAINTVPAEYNIPRHRGLAYNSGTTQIVNNFMPMSDIITLKPNDYYIGPIQPSNIQPLTDDLASYLDVRSNVLYVAFGQMYVPTQKEFNNIAAALLENYRAGIIDGILWASRGLPKDMLESFQANTTYDTTGFSNNPDIRFEKWVPQYSVLNHTATKLFLSHAGAASSHDAIFNGVPMLLYPFASDQPTNSVLLERAGVALVINRKATTMERISRKIKVMLIDRREEFVSNMKQMQTIALISSKRKELAADILETQALASRNGKPWYLHMEHSPGTLFGFNVFSLIGILVLYKLCCVGAKALLRKLWYILYLHFIPMSLPKITSTEIKVKTM